MIRISTAFFGILLVFGGIRAENVFELSKEQKTQVDSAVDDMINCRFDQAFAGADSFETGAPSDPLGSLLRLMTHGLRDLDCNRTLDARGLLDSYSETIRRIQSHERLHGQSSYTTMLAGFANAAHAAFHLNESHYFSAIGTGVDALKQLHSAKEMDERNADVDFFIGLYDYGKTELRRRLWMVLFWYPGDKAEGIRKLENCAEKGLLAASAAKMALADIYAKENRHAEAFALIEELKTEYPESRFILWSEAKYWESLNNHAKAANTYSRLAEAYRSVEECKCNYLEVRAKEVEHLTKAGQHEAAERVAGRVVAKHCGDDESRDSPCRRLEKHKGREYAKSGP